MAEFQEGFYQKAQELGKEVVGEPVEDEHRIVAKDIVIQLTTTGMMLWHEPTNTTHFFEAAR